MARWSLLFFLVLGALHANADGGRLRLREPAGPFIVTLVTGPDPIREGPADFSIAVERPGAPGIVEDAQVTLILTPADRESGRLVRHASHGAATSRFLQAANFALPQSGLWRMTIVVQQGTQVGLCSGEFEAYPATLVSSTTTWQIVVVPFAILLFAIHQWRKREFTNGKQTAPVIRPS